MNALASSALLYRPNFIGVTDRYSPLNGSPASPKASVEKAMDGIAPFDVSGELLSENYLDSAALRLERYRHSWHYYRGNHFINMFEDGEKKVVVNYCANVVEKGIDWFLADGFTITATEGNEDAADYLMTVFKGNSYLSKFRKALQYGAVTGDSFFYVTVETKDSDGNDLPKDKWRIRFDALNPAHCFPFWSKANPDELDSILIQYPMVSDQGSPAVLYSMYITRTTYQVWAGTESKAGVQVNPFGKVNVVHIPNFIEATSLYGKSDLHDVMPLNDELNQVATSIRRIIKYHAEPTTIIYGARASQLEKGAKKVWSGLPGPGDAKVENLQLQSDLKATYDWYDKLQTEISVVSETPKILLDQQLNRISNTSGVAIQLLYHNIIAKTDRRRVTHQKGIAQICDLILIAAEVILGDDLTVLTDNPESIRDIGVLYTSPLPKDEQIELDTALKKVSAGIWSQAEAIRRCSGVLDLTRLALELAADTRAKMALAAETQRAMTGGNPVMSAAFLSSPFLFVDLESIAKQSNQETEAGKNG